jgi:hypothetical protein
MEKAIKAAVPDAEEIGQLPVRKEELTKELDKLKSERNRLVRKIAQGVISDDVAKDTLDEYADREVLLMQEISKIDYKLESVPSRRVIGITADLIKRHIETIHKNGRKYAQITFEEKRKLAQFAFSGQDPEGRRCGVYLEKTDSEKYPWRFTIRGVLKTRKNERLPLREWQVRSILGIEDESSVDWRSDPVDFVQRTYQQEMLCSDKG